jgi:hypothetical protein
VTDLSKEKDKEKEDKGKEKKKEKGKIMSRIKVKGKFQRTVGGRTYKSEEAEVVVLRLKG